MLLLLIRLPPPLLLSLFIQDGRRGFISNGQTDHITMLSLRVSESPTSGQVESQTRLDIGDSSLPADDVVEDLELSHGEELLLIRCRTTLVIYSLSRQRVANVIQRPGDVPAEFRLPGSGGGFVALQFTQAHFNDDDKVRLDTWFGTLFLSLSEGINVDSSSSSSPSSSR